MWMRIGGRDEVFVRAFSTYGGRKEGQGGKMHVQSACKAREDTGSVSQAVCEQSGTYECFKLCRCYVAGLQGE